jgi:hypothetical protein
VSEASAVPVRRQRKLPDVAVVVELLRCRKLATEDVHVLLVDDSLCAAAAAAAAATAATHANNM